MKAQEDIPRTPEQIVGTERAGLLAPQAKRFLELYEYKQDRFLTDAAKQLIDLLQYQELTGKSFEIDRYTLALPDRAEKRNFLKFINSGLGRFFLNDAEHSAQARLLWAIIQKNKLENATFRE